MTTKNKNLGMVLGLALILMMPLQSFGQKNLGIGVRLGDPSGITIKKYLSKNALEFNIGRSYPWYGRGRWYNDNFDNWYAGKKYAYKEYQYIGYRSQFPLSIQARYLFQRPIGKVGKENLSGLDWYLGVGGQFRYRSYYYDYRYKIAGDPSWYYVRDAAARDFDLGVDGIIGLEYTFKELPLSIFADVNLFMEIVNDPFWFDAQGGAGVRYNF